MSRAMICCGLLAVIIGGLVFLALDSGVKVSRLSDDGMPEIMCVEEADGKYYVCYFDETKRGLVRCKGVRFTEEQLPTVWTGPLSYPAIVYVYQRPTWLRRLRGLPALHYFAPPRHRIIGEGDPRLVYALHQKTRNLELFFGFATDSYIIKEIPSPKLRKGVKIGVVSWTDRRRIKIDIPAHRAKEVEELLSQLTEPKGEQ
jgi:hypothetical protein